MARTPTYIYTVADDSKAELCAILGILSDVLAGYGMKFSAQKSRFRGYAEHGRNPVSMRLEFFQLSRCEMTTNLADIDAKFLRGCVKLFKR